MKLCGSLWMMSSMTFLNWTALKVALFPSGGPDRLGCAEVSTLVREIPSDSGEEV